jgi:dipeptidase D
MAAGLAFLDLPEDAHGPLELLMTVDEERGLVGARSLRPDFIRGRLLFNLDSEEDGVFYIGCAGGQDTEIELPHSRRTSASGVGRRITIRGLRGGHSGLDIHLNRGNAIKLLARLLHSLSRETGLGLASIDGGDKHNAIPREASALVVLHPEADDTVKRVAERELAGFREEYGSSDPGLAFDIASENGTPEVMDSETRDRILRLLLGLPHGVLALVREIPGKVETSSNVARVHTSPDALKVLVSVRSSVASALEGVTTQIEAVGSAAGGRVEKDEGYPGWRPDPDSRMLAEAVEVWRKVHESDPKLEVVHAGLECGLIGERYPGMDMISLGPTINDAHSPDERVSITTVKRFFDFTKAFLAEMARG